MSCGPWTRRSRGPDGPRHCPPTPAAVLTGVHDALVARGEEFERLLVAETGKPVVDCRVEVARTLLIWQTVAQEVALLHGEAVPLDLLPSGDGLVGLCTRRPIGIAGLDHPCCSPPTRPRPRSRRAAR
jgi:acyl-CoA reductase-like NAD-dependent aldehyde dehydrogenase